MPRFTMSRVDWIAPIAILVIGATVANDKQRLGFGRRNSPTTGTADTKQDAAD